jgi:hypothetical protein
MCSRKDAVIKVLQMTIQHQRSTALAATNGSVVSRSSGGSSANGSMLGYGRSHLIDSILQRDEATPDAADMSMSPGEQRELLQGYKELFGELEEMKRVIAVVKETHMATALEKQQLRVQLEGRNQLLTELFQPRDGGPREIAETIFAMQTKMELQVELQQQNEDSVCSVDQSFIFDRLQTMVVGGNACSGLGSMNVSRVTTSLSDCVQCHQPVPAGCGQTVPSLGLLHDKCLLCSAFGCGVRLEASKAVVRDSLLFCQLHVEAPPVVPSTLCGV